MPSSFFTNEKENTLKNRINYILKEDKNIAFLDFLIGYFRITGFDKISDNLSSIEHTRILVGINADKGSYHASQLIQKFSREQVDFYNEEPLDFKQYANFATMKNLIIQKKIEIRISENRDVHSKMYVMRSDKKQNHEGNEAYRGCVIIGSSNLTHNGLEANTEINAELQDEKSLNDAVSVFNRLWEESVELTEEDFDSYIMPKIAEPLLDKEALTPYQVYIKLLISHFGKRVDFLDDKNIFVPKAYKKLSYQIEAVNDGIAKLKEHNGFFLSDVVGLGKTVVIAMLIKKLESTTKDKVLVVIPPAVRMQWEDTFEDFEIKHFDIVSLASLEKVNANAYKMIIVDESHKFKNSKSKRYQQLLDICLNKKVILLSATPQNNTPNDLYAQLSLFQNVKQSSLPYCRNLQSFFKDKEEKYKKIINSEDSLDKKGLEALSISIRDKVLRSIMIRRTRYDIQHHKMYKADIEAQGLSIPKVNMPIEHEYKLEGKLASVFDTTAIAIGQKLNYSRFNALGYLTEEAIQVHYSHESKNILSKNPLAGIMKTLLIKRFESSFYAFKISIKRHLERYEAFIKHYQEDKIYLGDKASDILDYSEEEGDYEGYIQDLISKKKVKVLQKSDFEKAFEEDLKADYKIFKALVATWKDMNTDPKLKKFEEVIFADKDKKIVIFTESVDTLNYLKSKLSNTQKILFITSQNREEQKERIKENFDANYDQAKQKNDYDMIITTDTLAEGINLHRSHIIYNYDIPWNATKLIQRIGRVNRIGTKAKYIDIHNFKPASHIDKLLELSQKAFVKLQSSHTMMGEDNAIYTSKEEVSSVTLFDEYKQEAQEKDEELAYLEVLRAFRKQYPKTFISLKNLKENLAITREAKEDKSYISLFVNDKPQYLYSDKKQIKQITFVETAQALEVSLSQKRTSKHIPSLHQDILDQAINYFEEKHKRTVQENAENSTEGTLPQTAIRYLKEWLKKAMISKEDFKKYKKILNNGSLNTLYIKEIIKLHLLENEEIKSALKTIIETKIQHKKEAKLFDENLLIHPILSEVFIKD